MISPDDPPLQASGEALLEIDTQGRLQSLRVVPPEESRSDGTAPADWNVLLQAAGIKPGALTPVTPLRMAVPSDHRAAWTWRDRGAEARVEAASVAGRPVYFKIVSGTTRPPSRPGVNILIIATFAATILLVIFLVWRNVRLGRGDLRGATRIGLVTGTGMMVTWLFGADHVATLAEVGMILKALSWAAFTGLMLWAAYLALEPVFRRRWPQSLVTWARLLAGGWRDPLVGRDVLAGCVAGAASLAALTGIPLILAALRGTTAPPLLMYDFSILNGTRQVIAELASISTRAVVDAILPLTMLVLLRIVLRRNWIAAVAYLALELAMSVPGTPDRLASAIGTTFDVVLILVLLRYFGFLSLVMKIGIDAMLSLAPVLWPPASWHTGIAIAVVGVVLAIAIYGFITSLGGRRLIASDLLEA
jgi:hypothetical protein